MEPTIDIRAGTRALAHLRERGLAPADIRAMPAAAGGPKGLALIPFDQRFADAWLPAIPHLDLIGASIGAWRVAALSQPDARDALERLRRAYVHDQDYAPDPSPAEVSARIRAIARAVLGPAGLCVRERVSLDVIVARSRGPLDGRRSRAAFGRAALANAWSRARLAAHFERVALHAGAASALPPARDAFGRTEVVMDATNALDALTATASIPLACEPVASIAGAPRGEYWDGGMIDYHLMLPYDALDGIVLYPHFVPHVTPGWLDKHLPWRARPRRHRWLANVVVIAPSRALLARLPNGKLPDRVDFYRYGQDHARRIRDWNRAIDECERFADAAMRWLERPDPSLARPL